jgi:Na+/H+-dicarboxylate symporter
VLIKEILIFALPIMVCFFIAASLAKFEKQAPLFILLLIIFEACSNFTSVWYAYGMGQVISDFVTNVNSVQQDLNGLKPYFSLAESKPEWWTISKGTIVGLILGLLCAQAKLHKMRNLVIYGKSIIELILTKIFARLIPLFVLGFVANVYAMDLVEKLFVEFIGIIVWVLAAILVYLFILYLIAAKFNIATAIKNIINLLPAGFVALTSGCSLSTMPFTIKGTAKNLQDPEFAKMVIPATTNIQQIGDCIINALLCLVIIKSFGHPLPNLYTWLQFSIVFTLARFATAAVIGGAIFIVLPIYAAYLNFTGEMIAIILALNIILDPIVTASNVMANAALCYILENIWNRKKMSFNLEY